MYAGHGRIVRFFGPRGDSIVADQSGVSVCNASGSLRFRAAFDHVLDAVAVGSEIWVATHDHLTRLAVADGATLGIERIPELHAPGRFRQSSTLPGQPVWHGDRPRIISVNPGRAEPVPGPATSIALPVAAGRWLLWEPNQLRYWRTGIGEAWRSKVGEPGSEALDAQLVLEGRLLVLVQRRGSSTSNSIVHLTVAQTSDGAQNLNLRLPSGTKVAIAGRSGVAMAWAGEEARLLNLRFGRWIRDLAIPAGVEDIVVDDSMEHVALVFADHVELTELAALAAVKRPDPDADADAALAAGSSAAIEAPELRAAPDAPPRLHIAALPPDPIDPTDPADPAQVAEPEAEPAASEIGDIDSLPEVPLVRLEPLSVTPLATPEERTLALELHLRLIGALANVAIAAAWDEGRIVTAAPNLPPFAEELGGLLRITHGLRATELAEAYDRLREIDHQVDAAQLARDGRASPLETLQRDFGLSQLAALMLFAIAAPRLRGELARVFGILANDPGRPLVDEHLLSLLLGEDPQRIASELDADLPLRRHGLVQLGAGTRPFASLTVEPLVIRHLANLDLDGESDDVLVARAADRSLAQLDLPRERIASAVQYLSAPRANEPARLVLRGRTGAGRHTLLAALAARVGRAIGIIDVSNVQRDRARVTTILEGALRRAKLRGLIPCVDGLELIDPENPELRQHLTAVLRRHPGPLAVRLPLDGRPPLDPGYLQLDLPVRTEYERVVSWSSALARHHIELADATDLAARYRVGPGIIERVCVDVANRALRPTDAAGWLHALDDTVRYHLVNRIGDSATRVNHLASWTDIVLPEDISDTLLEITSRVRHRKVVFEQWGFTKSVTSARGITALFQGSPGTGKTLVAGAIARDLGLELYRVDVSRITSKWIGETEKNLGALFDAAEDGQVMLLFDEADSLFAKRTEVKSSVDRYANQEVNYLLQRLDTFEGVAVLTTNFGNSIDSAFKRRLTYRVTFPFPDEEMREQLWRSLIPAQVPIGGTIDFATLAQRFRLSGGYIRNAALRAAFLAVEEGSFLTHAHIERAIRMEFREIGKLAETGALE